MGGEERREGEKKGRDEGISDTRREELLKMMLKGRKKEDERGVREK